MNVVEASELCQIEEDFAEACYDMSVPEVIPMPLNEDVFVAAISEMRAPAARILGWVDHIRTHFSSELTPTQLEHLMEIEKSVHQLEALIAQVETGEILPQDYHFHIFQIGGATGTIHGYAGFILRNLDDAMPDWGIFLENINRAGRYLHALRNDLKSQTSAADMADRESGVTS